MSYKKISFIVCGALVAITLCINIVIMVRRPVKREYVYESGNNGPMCPTPESAVEAYFYNYTVPVTFGLDDKRFVDLSAVKQLTLTPEMYDSLYTYVNYLKKGESLKHKFPYYENADLDDPTQWYGHDFEFNLLLMMDQNDFWDSRLDTSSEDYYFDSIIIYLNENLCTSICGHVNKTNVSSVENFTITDVGDYDVPEEGIPMPEVGGVDTIHVSSDIGQYNQFMHLNGLDDCQIKEPDEWKIVYFSYSYTDASGYQGVDEYSTVTCRYGDEWYVYSLDDIYTAYSF